MQRKTELVTGEFYHVFNKSVEDLTIFRNRYEFERMLGTMQYYQLADVPCNFANAVLLAKYEPRNIRKELEFLREKTAKQVKIIAYCLMPTHIHFVLQQLQADGIMNFMRLIQNSYSCYFNNHYKRRGPLWIGRFEAKHIADDNLLAHEIRYVHLNPTTAYLVDDPSAWGYSSYREYLGRIPRSERIAEWEDILTIDGEKYKKFVEGQIECQRALALAKKSNDTGSSLHRE